MRNLLSGTIFLILITSFTICSVAVAKDVPGKKKCKIEKISNIQSIKTCKADGKTERWMIDTSQDGFIVEIQIGENDWPSGPVLIIGPNDVILIKGNLHGKDLNNITPCGKWECRDEDGKLVECDGLIGICEINDKFSTCPPCKH